ncbi:MAG TPA: hypothetical protein VHO68_12840, partial [Bacteroidales bacterium]|nr:hypothetical protein [Bacteroidales bacterium]
ERCASGIAGSDMVSDLWDFKKQINLDKITWLTNHGVYAGLYKGPLFKLGLLEMDNRGKVVVTKIGRPVAEAFNRAVSFTEWAKNGRSRAAVTRAEVQQFGAQSCPCSLSRASSELNALRQLFFETDTLEGRVLSQSLGFILSVVDQCERYGFSDIGQSFRLAMYYRKIYKDKDHPVNFKVLRKLDQIVTRWRSFQAHDYFSFSLESFLAVWLEVMFSQPSQKITLQEFMDQIDNKVFIATLKERLGFRPSVGTLRDLNLGTLFGALLKKAGLSSLNAQDSASFDKSIGLKHELSEEQLKDEIWDRYRDGSQYEERCAEALILLMVLYVRFYYEHLQIPHQLGWNRYEATASQSDSDLGLPRFYYFFPLPKIRRERFSDRQRMNFE